MKTKSCKAKGRRLQQEVVRLLSEITGIPGGKDKDIDSRPMSQSGPDIILRGKAKELLPFSIECKNCESLNIYKAIEQAEKYGDPLVFFTKNRKPTYVALRADTWAKYMKELFALEEGEG